MLSVSSQDSTGVPWDGICVPAQCNSLGLCPPVGQDLSGVIHGRCKITGKCEYEREIFPSVF